MSTKAFIEPVPGLANRIRDRAVRIASGRAYTRGAADSVRAMSDETIWRFAPESARVAGERRPTAASDWSEWERFRRTCDELLTNQAMSNWAKLVASHGNATRAA